MATNSEARALPFFTDLIGQPLESGSIYIGQPGLDPVAYPAAVYSDVDQTVLLAQPVRTSHGHAVSGGAQVHMFCPSPYSITILDGSGRLVYASLNEVDPALIALGKTGVQSAATLAELRARNGSTTNQVWVNGYGMYQYIASDSTSPENVPLVIVGNDGSRYYLNFHYGNFGWTKVSSPSASPVSQGLWTSWNDSGNGIAYLTNNRGEGTGGVVIRNINQDNTVEYGRVTMSSTGDLSATGDIYAQGGDVRASGNVIAEGGTVAVTADNSRNLHWDSALQNYVFPSSPVQINGSLAVTVASLVDIILTQKVGAIIMTNAGAAPAFPGTWVAIVTGLGPSGIAQFLRTA
jgi:hypothetical protein